MNCVHKNYLYIYNIKLLEENNLLIEKKKLSNMFFVLLVLKNFFINSTKYFFFRTKIVFQNSIPKHNFFFLSKNTKNYSKKLFSKIVFKNNFKKQQPNRPLCSPCFQSAYFHRTKKTYFLCFFNCLDHKRSNLILRVSKLLFSLFPLSLPAILHVSH